MVVGRRWIRTVALGLSIALAGSVFSPLFAGEASPTAPLGPVAAVLAERARRTDLRAATTQETTAKTLSPVEEKSFFRTRKGVVVLALLAAGFGYAAYSAKSESIRSPVRW